jgi:hypothetical protein|uniref:Uncharacterized protein n=1 Tax=Populus trichocarpa TaxID=3694 RepID=A0A2K2BD89_POPTR
MFHHGKTKICSLATLTGFCLKNLALWREKSLDLLPVWTKELVQAACLCCCRRILLAGDVKIGEESRGREQNG